MPTLTKTKPVAIDVPRTADRKNYAKFEIPFATAQTSAMVYIPIADCPPGTTVTITITRGE